MEGRSTLIRLVGMAFARPRLGLELMRTAWRFRSKDWYRRPPFLPIPPPDYMAWRNETAWGSADAVAEPAALMRYLRWARSMRRGTKR